MKKNTRRHWLLISVVGFLISSSNPLGAQMDAELHTLAATRLKKLFQDASPRTTFAGDGDVVVTGQRIDVVPTVEHVAPQGGRWLSGVRFDLRLDRQDVPRFTFSTVGIGDSKDEANKVAVEE